MAAGVTMAGELMIRRANIADAAAIAGLTRELGYPVSEPDSRHWLGLMADSTDYGVFVASRDGHPLGWIVVERRLSLETGFKAEITGLVVSAAHRRQGIGEALVAEAVCWGRASGLDMLLVRSNVSRDASHPFYQSLGFGLSKTSHVYQLAL